MRTIVCGDVHGCLEELDELLRVVEYRQVKDRLVFVGDLVDRGPDSVGVVRRARELKADVVLGNHEEKHLRWRRWVQKVAAGDAPENPMKPFDEKNLAFQAALSEEDWEWMETWPLFLRLGNGWAVVHGGCLPGRPLEKQGKNIVRVRYVDLETKKFKPSRPGEQPDNTRYWSELWYGPESLFYGHAVFLKGPKRDQQRDLRVESSLPVDCIGLDTGCTFGGHLSAAILTRVVAHTSNGTEVLPTCALRIAQVKAKRKYSEPPCEYDE